MLLFYIFLNIFKLLISNAIDKDAKFDEMEKRIEDIEKYCDVYKNEIFAKDKRASKQKENRFYAPEKCEYFFIKKRKLF
jgi:hypothetical protein